MTTKFFFSAKIEGEAFHNHQLTTDACQGVAALGDLIKTIAISKVDPDDKERVKFLKDRALGFNSVRKGSAVLPFSLIAIAGLQSMFLEPEFAKEIFQESCNDVVSAIQAAKDGDDPTKFLRREHLKNFEKIRKGFGKGNTVTLNSRKNKKADAVLDKETYEKLKKFASIEGIESTVTLRGNIYYLHADNMSFGIQQIKDRKKIICPLHNSYLDIIKKSIVFSTENNADDQKALRRIEVKVHAQIDGAREIEKVKRVDSVRAIENPLYIPCQIDELRSIEKGWLFGSSGEPLDKEGLDWLEEKLETHNDLFSEFLPCIYPTEDGNVQMEWSNKRYAIDLEIDLVTKKGEWGWSDLKSDKNGDKSLSLKENKNWKLIGKMLNEKMKVENGS